MTLILQELDLDELMYTAIVKNRVDFVQLFLLERGVNLRNFLTFERLLDIYNKASDIRTYFFAFQ